MSQHIFRRIHFDPAPLKSHQKPVEMLILRRLNMNSESGK